VALLESRQLQAPAGLPSQKQACRGLLDMHCWTWAVRCLHYAPAACLVRLCVLLLLLLLLLLMSVWAAVHH
jgi:hypothetical protein